MAKINDIWDGLIDKREVHGLVPCCGQDGYRAQVPLHPIDSYTHLTSKGVSVRNVFDVRFSDP